MTLSPHDLARARFANVSGGDLPDSLLTDDFAAWIGQHFNALTVQENSIR